MSFEFLMTCLFWACIGGAVGAVIGDRKGKREYGFIMGFLLGPFGWLLAIATPSILPTCPECGGNVVAGARKCKNCGSELAQQVKRKKKRYQNPEEIEEPLDQNEAEAAMAKLGHSFES